MTLAGKEARDLHVSVFHRLQHRIAPAVHKIDVGALRKKVLNVRQVIFAMAAKSLDDWQMLSQRIGIGTSLIEEVAEVFPCDLRRWMW